jgi:pyrroline-5-carboxylate reductase
MLVGFIGSGNMARALARGWGEPVLATDSGSGRAAVLVEELGGEVVGSNRELVERADLVVLAHKPYQLDDVARDAADAAGPDTPIVSVLGGSTQAQVRDAWGGATVVRVEPNTPVEVRRGVLVFAEPDAEIDGAVLERIRVHFGRLGTVVDVPERLMNVAGACSGVGPAYWALFAEAHIEAAIRRGVPPATAAKLVTETMAGAAELLAANAGDTLAVRRAVTSPGGSTARGLAALERGGVRAALHDAMDEVVGG